MPAAAIKHNWLAGAFPPEIEKLLTALSAIRPLFSTASAVLRPAMLATPRLRDRLATSSVLRPLFVASARIRDAIAATIARIRHDPPGD
jgi:hypothetical protein